MIGPGTRRLSDPGSLQAGRVGLTWTREETVLCPSSAGASEVRLRQLPLSPRLKLLALGPSSHSTCFLPRLPFTSLPLNSGPQPVWFQFFSKAFFRMTLVLNLSVAGQETPSGA